MANALSLKPGKNYAPLKPLLELRDSAGKETQSGKLSHYITDAIRERYNHHMEEDKETWNDLIQVGHLTSLFIQGKQNLRWDKLTNSFYAVPIDRRQKDKMRVTPIMRFYETNCESRYMSSNPKIKVKAAREDDRARQSADGANTIVEYHEKELYTSWFNRSEALHKMSFGTQILQCRWANEKEGFKAFRRVFEEREIPISEGVGQCFDCGRNGTGTEFLQTSPIPVCPYCNSSNAYAEPPTSAMIPVEKQKILVNLGGVELKQLEFPACRWNLRVRAEESSHFIYEQIISMGLVRNLLGDVILPDDLRGENNFGLEVVESLARAGMPLGGNTSTDDQVRSKFFRQRVKLTEYYLSAEDMSDIKCRGDEQTLCGETLPKDATYADIFPEGATFYGLNGMHVLIGIYPKAAHKDELITGIWHQRQFSGAGQGVSDTVELNRRLNETDSQAFMAMKHNATPGVFYLDGAIEREYLEYVGHPDVAIPINMDVNDNAKSINDIIASPRLGNTDAGMLQYYSQNLHNMIQLTMHVTSFSGGLPGVKNTTATGAQISEANAASLFGPILAIKTDNRIEAAKKFVSLYRDNVPVQQYFPLESKYGAQQGVWLAGADLSKDLVFTVVENSMLPKTQYTVRDDIDRFFMTVGGGQGFMALRQADPEFADEISDKYGVNFAVSHFDEVAQINRERFESAKKLIRQFRAVEQQTNQIAAGLPSAESVGADPSVIETQFDGESYQPYPPDQASQNPQPDPTGEIGQPQETALARPQAALPVPDPAAMLKQTAQMVLQMLKPRITMYEPNHEQKADWFANFLDTDEGRMLDELTREVVYAFIENHFMLGAQRAAAMAQLQGQVQVAGAMPGQIADTAKQQFLAAQNNQTKSN